MIVDSALYVDGARRPGRSDTTDWRSICGDDAFSWTGLFEPTKAEFEQIRLHIDLHDLVVEDALNAHQRPKLEQYGSALFLVLKTAKYLDDIEEVEFGEIQVFVTPMRFCTSVTTRRRGLPECARRWKATRNSCGMDRALCCTPSSTTSSTLRTNRCQH